MCRHACDELFHHPLRPSECLEALEVKHEHGRVAVDVQLLGALLLLMAVLAQELVPLAEPLHLGERLERAATARPFRRRRRRARRAGGGGAVGRGKPSERARGGRGRRMVISHARDDTARRAAGFGYPGGSVKRERGRRRVARSEPTRARAPRRVDDCCCDAVRYGRARSRSRWPKDNACTHATHLQAVAERALAATAAAAGRGLRVASKVPWGRVDGRESDGRQ